jgi:thiosulfate/3-mercaptopyruvate sulfurtransferase
MYKTLIDVPTLCPKLWASPTGSLWTAALAWRIRPLVTKTTRPPTSPGAVYAHLDDDLSGPPVTDHGRHPLPTPQRLAQLFSRLGIDEMSQVVAYDDAGGMVAARLWWMLRYMRHDAVAVLDGGWPAWQAANLPTASGVERNEPAQFTGRPQPRWLVTLDEVADTQPLLS